MKEQDIAIACHRYLHKQKHIKLIATEVPYLSRCIDLAYITEEDLIVTIEFKLHNWRKAIEQVNDHRLGADMSYICMPRPKTGWSEEFLGFIQKTGIGLFEYVAKRPNPLELVVEARTKDNRWPPLVESLREVVIKIAQIEKTEEE